MATVNVGMRKAGDLMHKGIETIRGSAIVTEGPRKMQTRKVSRLIVGRRDLQDAWVTITKKDIVTKVIDPRPHRREGV